MIDIVDKKDCVGCNACVQICPKKCISFESDSQGFKYPKVDINACIQCNLCEKVCPVIHQGSERMPLGVCAAYNEQEAILLSSSSGGVFFALAKNIIEEGGVVFGARFNEDWDVIHDYTDTIEGLTKFKGSKYVQSTIGDSFRKAEYFLKKGVNVLFSGTSCQIAALGLFLRKDYGQQLIKVEVICHGVPSPLVWRDYLKYFKYPQNTLDSHALNKDRARKICSISFRDKELGWEKFRFKLFFRDSDQQPAMCGADHCNSSKTCISTYHNDDPYFWAFNNSFSLRPSCFNCPAKTGKSGADIALGDFWHIKDVNPNFYNEKGVSLVLIYSKQGMELFGSVKLTTEVNTFENAKKCVPSIVQSSLEPSLYLDFWEEYDKNGISAVFKFFKKYQYTKIEKYLKNPLKKIIGQDIIRKTKKLFRQ